jgi:hypothetical protein
MHFFEITLYMHFFLKSPYLLEMLSSMFESQLHRESMAQSDHFPQCLQYDYKVVDEIMPWLCT